MDEAIEEFRPDLIIYNAGTDCLIGDPLGGLDLSPQGELLYFPPCLLSDLPTRLFIPAFVDGRPAFGQQEKCLQPCSSSIGIIMRDEMVFRVAKRNNLSVAMVMSGGYQVGAFLLVNLNYNLTINC